MNEEQKFEFERRQSKIHELSCVLRNELEELSDFFDDLWREEKDDNDYYDVSQGLNDLAGFVSANLEYSDLSEPYYG